MRALAVVALLLAPALAACLATVDDGVAPLGVEPRRVVDPEGRPVPHAAAALLAADGATLAVLSAGPDGLLDLSALPPLVARVVVAAPGFAPWIGGLDALPSPLVLARSAEPLADDLPILRLLPPVELGRAYLADDPRTCAFHNCGASEPSIEVAADGTLYATGVCCVAKSPPIWMSRDGGATWTDLPGDVLQETFGIEGDFAIDDAGNLYFTDISAASAYIASWDKDGNHRWTVPIGPFLPIVDRPWVRAGAENVVYFAYNMGAQTAFYRSEDGGRTWAFKSVFPANLGTLGQGPERDRLWVAAGNVLYESADGGDTWSAGEGIRRPTEEGNRHMSYNVPVVDEAGNVWVVYDWRDRASHTNSSSPTQPQDTDAVPYHVWAARRDAAGDWHGPFRVSPEGGTHAYPWAAAGRDGTLAVAWYGAPDARGGPDSVGAGTPWYLHVAVTVDGTSAAPSFQVARGDPEPVLHGPLGRRLLDFLQIDIGPEGALHVAYAKNPTDASDEATWFVRSTTGLALAPGVYPNGPKAAAGAADAARLPFAGLSALPAR